MGTPGSPTSLSDGFSESSPVTKQSLTEKGTEIQHSIPSDSANNRVDKLKILNSAIQDIGFGKYHRRLFFVSGFGWFIDSAFPIVTSLILPAIVSEYKYPGAVLVLAANAGQLCGALIWGLVCDVQGRRWPFNVTLLVAGVFGLAAGGAPTFVTLSVLMAIVGFGVGGNIPVDSAIFLEFIPSTHQYLLTALATFWILGLIFVNLIAWPLMANFSCQYNTDCQRADNMGWRYLLFTIGGVTLAFWVIRFFAFHLYESPRYLMGRGRVEEAVGVVQKVAKFNGASCTLRVEDLKDETEEAEFGDDHQGFAYVLQRLRSLFACKQAALSTSLLIVIWSVLSLGTTLYNSFLPFLLTARGATFGDASIAIAYRNQLIISVSGILSPFIASQAVEVPALGRRGALCGFCVLTGTFLLASTTAGDSTTLLGWNCGYSFCSNGVFSVLYSFTSEVFPTKNRGTGNAIASMSGRMFGVIAPLIGLYVDVTTAVPAYIGASLMIAAGFLALLVPYEPRGKDAI
ncbi:MFS general substrate transporter [Coprinopsis marcescibilis]|uniref:MFS general substrate transporter n=1 Tax=Coprinopsis marcescibilis TaxID=230819 RepID=A0A5C3L462_COPMA|nr:MFS general substrate transporter [Coprinopsis marcescibilis]